MLIGLVGKPSAGKSSMFSAATLVDAKIASYPFTTIEPNKGVGFVRVACADQFFNVQCNPRTGFCHQHTRYVPVDLLDVAGLVPGAHEGKGLGNAFLSDLSRADVLIHVVDASGSTNEKGETVPANSHDPCLDVSFLENEIDWWFEGVLDKNWAKIAKQPVAGMNAAVEALMAQLSGLNISRFQMEQSLVHLKLDEQKFNAWSLEDRKNFAAQLRKRSKPILIAANKADIPGALENVEKMKKAFPSTKIIACSAQNELVLKKAAKAGMVEYWPGDAEFQKLKQGNEAQEKAFSYVQETFEKMHGTGVQQALESALFDVLHYIHVFPGGTKKLTDSQGRVLPDCFLLPAKTTALEFAFSLHSDLGNHFIRAIDVKTRQTVGKEHELKAGDVIEIVHSG